MTIFSYDIFSAQAAGGVSRSMLELMRALDTIGCNWQLWAGSHANELLGAVAGEVWTQDRMQVDGRMTAPSRFVGSLRNEVGFARAVRRSDSRVVHRTYYPVVDLCGRGVRRVETLHDMWDERAGQQSDRLTHAKSLFKRRAVARADRVVCVSESTRREVSELWPWAEDKLMVVPHGVRRLATVPRPAERACPYFLFVGRRDLYKNFAVAVAALRQAHLPDHELLCFGGGAFSPGERALIASAGLSKRVHQLEGDDDCLAGLYEAASALLYPSSYEGFGLPLLEAMIHDCPAIAAPLTSLPEVGGAAALYADPVRPDLWAAAMETIVNDSPTAARLRRLGRARAAEFTWESAAERYRDLYRELA